MSDTEVKAVSPLDYRLIDTVELAPHALNAMQFRAQGSDGLKTRAALSHRILELIHAYALDGRGVRLATLNRKFGKACAALSYSARNVALDLTEAGKLMQFDHEGNTVLFSKAVWDEREAALAGDPDVAQVMAEARTAAVSGAL